MKGDSKMKLTTIQDDKKSKRIYLEIIRIISILFVVFNHSSTIGFQLYTVTENRFLYPVYCFCSILCKVAVPLFLMVSGALLLKKDEDFKTIFKKRVSKILIILIVFSVICYIKKYKCFDIKDFIELFLRGGIATPYWYLYSYICYLMSLPLLRLFINNCNILQHYKCFVFLGVVFQLFIPALKYILGINITSSINFPMISDFIVYPLLGYMLANINITVKDKIIIYILTVLSFIASFVLMSKVIQIDKMNQAGTGTFCFFITIFVFILCKDIGNRIDSNCKVSKIILLTGECVFGVYLLEPIVVRNVMFRIATILSNYIPTLISTIIGCLGAVICGTIFVYVIKRITLIIRNGLKT